MKSVDSHIKIIEQIQNHQSLDKQIKSKLSVCGSFLSMDYIAHYGEVLNCLSYVDNNKHIIIGIGYLFDKERTYTIFRLVSGTTHIICNSIDHVVAELKSIISLSIPSGRLVHTSNINNHDHNKDTQSSLSNPYNFSCYTTYIRKQVMHALENKFNMTGYYNRKRGSTRHLEFIRARTDIVPWELNELSYKLPIRPYIKNGYIAVAFNEGLL